MPMPSPEFSTDSDSGERRSHRRQPVVAPTVVRPTDEFAAIEVETRDLSTTGCLFISARQLAVGTRITLGLSGAGRASAIVVRSAGHAHACVFERPLSTQEQKAAFTGTALLRLAEEPAAGQRGASAGKLARHHRYRLLLALGALAWAVPAAVAWIAFA